MNKTDYQIESRNDTSERHIYFNGVLIARISEDRLSFVRIYKDAFIDYWRHKDITSVEHIEVDLLHFINHDYEARAMLVGAIIRERKKRALKTINKKTNFFKVGFLAESLPHQGKFL
jgi:hypothetical protein